MLVFHLLAESWHFDEPFALGVVIGDKTVEDFITTAFYTFLTVFVP